MNTKQIREVTFKLRDDVDPRTGTLIPGRYIKRYFGTADVPGIEKSISELMDQNKEPEEDIKFDVTLYGKLNGIILTFLALDLQDWSDIHGLVYISPGEDPIRYLPRKGPVVR